MRITFHGAAGEVTGSQHLIENKEDKVLFDCGLFQGRREESYDKNRHPAYDSRALTSVVLSHAHLDHTGKLPRLAALGFNGPVFSTPITAQLCDPLLRDSAHIQSKDLEFVNKIHRRKGTREFNALYGVEDVEKVLKQFRTHELHSPFSPADSFTVTYLEAGHLLGSAQVVIEVHSPRPCRVGFTGDLGRKRLPILEDPEQLSDLDVLITESTYGNREHEDVSDLQTELSEVVNSTWAKRGKLIIPAFALERTQDLLYYLASLRSANRIPHDLPIFVDSPLALKATKVFANNSEAYDDKMLNLISSGTNPFDFPGLRFIETPEESKALNGDDRPMIIIAASGMCEAGRILHHLKNNIEDPKNTVLIVSFQAQHTLGRRIAERAEQVNIFGEPYLLRARVKILNSFSGHAGRTELIENIRAVAKNSPRLKKIFFVHGEPEPAEALMAEVKSMTRAQLHYPERGQSFEL